MNPFSRKSPSSNEFGTSWNRRNFGTSSRTSSTKSGSLSPIVNVNSPSPHTPPTSSQSCSGSNQYSYSQNTPDSFHRVSDDIFDQGMDLSPDRKVKKEPRNEHYGLRDEDDDEEEEEEESYQEVGSGRNRWNSSISEDGMIDEDSTPVQIIVNHDDAEASIYRPRSPPRGAGRLTNDQRPQVVHVPPRRIHQSLLCEIHHTWDPNYQRHHVDHQRHPLHQQQQQHLSSSQTSSTHMFSNNNHPQAHPHQINQLNQQNGLELFEGMDQVDFQRLTEEEVLRVIEKQIPWLDLNCYLQNNILGLRSLKDMIVSSGGQFNPYTKELIEEMKRVLEEISNCLVQKENSKFFDFDLRHKKITKRVRHSSCFFDQKNNVYYVTFGKKVRFVAYIHNMIRFQVRQYQNIKDHIQWTILYQDGSSKVLDFELKANEVNWAFNHSKEVTNTEKQKKRRHSRRKRRKRKKKNDDDNTNVVMIDEDDEPDPMIDNDCKMFLQSDFTFESKEVFRLKIEMRSMRPQPAKRAKSLQINGKGGKGMKGLPRHIMDNPLNHVENLTISRPPSTVNQNNNQNSQNRGSNLFDGNVTTCVSDQFTVKGFCDAQYRKKVTNFRKNGFIEKCGGDDLMQKK